MIYHVRAIYDPKKLQFFAKKLTDGTIEAQKPDGSEIVDSMKRAKITAPKQIEWYEKCFCPTPLQHERRTVYDHFIDIVSTKESGDYGEVEGKDFWPVLMESLEE